MQDIKYSTASEKALLIAIQKSIGSYANGVIGCQTLSDIAIKLKAKS